MAHLFTFPGPKAAEVLTYPSLREAERAANGIAVGAVFILSTLSAKSLAVIPLPLLRIVHNSALRHSDASATVPRLRTKPEAVKATLPLIAGIAKAAPTEEHAMATRKSSKKAPSKKAAAKKATGGRPGRQPSLAGQTLVRTEKGIAARRNADSRRTATWGHIPNTKKGIKYEKALEAGGHRDDIIILIRIGHLTAS